MRSAVGALARLVTLRAPARQPSPWPAAWQGANRGGGTAFTLIAFGLLLASTTHAIPKVKYRLPPSAHLPLSAAGVRNEDAGFAAIFCSVLATQPEWSSCDQYLESAPVAPQGPLGAFPTEYRIVVLPGVLGECVSDTVRTYSDAAAHIKATYGTEVEYLALPAFGSSKTNGKVLADYIKEQRATDPIQPPRRYLVVGYSKGAADALAGVSDDEELAAGVAAVISVAGSIAGSRAVDVLPKWLRRVIVRMAPEKCGKGDGRSWESLGRKQSQEFLATSYDPCATNVYCIVAVSDLESTSRVLRQGWRDLQYFALEQDSQMIAYDAIAPRSTYLGVARGDHWAVAMPFEDTQEKWLHRAVNRNHFPREALFESLIRFVAADLHDHTPCEPWPSP